MDITPYWLPILHRVFPTLGPGGLASALRFKLHADTSRMVHVTRYFDVMEVWNRDEAFSVRTYDQRMSETTGAFILGMNDLARYTPDAKAIGRAVRRSDELLVRRIAREETESVMERVRRVGRVDVVRELSETVSIRLVMRYFGLRYEKPTHLLHLFQKASWYIFSFWSDPVMRDAAVAAGEELRQVLAALVATRKRSGAPSDDDVLGRLLASPEGFVDGDRGIERSLAGLGSGTLNAPIGLFAKSMDKLVGLDEPERAAVHDLARAATEGDAAAESRLRDYLYEAERFNVFPSVLYRYAEHATTLARGTSREKAVPGATTVVVWPSLAAFDSEIFERPFDFVPGRPKWQYMGFGQGRHRCLGEHIGQVLIEEMARSLLALPHLRRAPGEAGTVQTRPIQEASFPRSFVLEFDKVA
jgi:cytochrome P450